MADGNRGKNSWRGGGEAPKRSAKYGWKPTETAAPGSGRKHVLFGITFALLIASAAAFLWIVVLPKAPPQPCLVVLGANPAEDAEKLDVPMDLYGWASGKQFIATAKARAGEEFAPHVATNPEGNPQTLPADEAGLKDWANGLKQFNPLVIYAGVHCGSALPDGPMLYVGGRQRVSVKALIAVLGSGPLKDKQKVLLLDNGRLPSSAVYGQLHDDFAARVKGMSAEIAGCANLVVICGAEKEQRAWESEELHATAFANAVATGLAGAAAGTTDLVTAKQLFEYVRTATDEWGIRNRESKQTPFLLPEGDEGLSRAAAINVAVKPGREIPKPPTPPAFVVPDDYAQLWKRHDDLAKQVPSPAAYTPRLWRRYRELLLRHQQALRAGDASAASKLKMAIAATDDAIAAKALPAFTSTANSLGIAAAAGTANPKAEEALRTLAATATLEAKVRIDRAVGEFPAGDNLERPVETHLPAMVQDFYATVAKSPAVAAEWPAAIALRRKVERAVFGLPESAPREGHLYAEATWPAIREMIASIDSRRRAAEDVLFSSDAAKRAAAAGEIASLRQDCETAVAAAAVTRQALARRDARLAELLLLTEWYANRRMSDAEMTIVEGAWKNAHALSKQLDQVPNADVDLASARLDAACQTLGKALETEIATYGRSDAAGQTAWLAKQAILNTIPPLLSAEDRVAVLTTSRRISAGLLSGGTRQAGVAIGSTDATTDPRNTARNRARLAKAVLGDDLLNAQSNTTRPKADFLEKDIADLATLPAWEDKSLALGAKLADHFQCASALFVVGAVDPAERFSRVSLPFDRDEGWEPATVNARRRWQAFHTALADRIAEDHWYDERQRPYFQVAAQRHLDDAKKLTADIPGLPPFAVPPELTAKLADVPLEVKPVAATVQWTTELARSVGFQASIPPGFVVAGQAVAVRAVDGTPPLLKSTASDRPLIAIGPGTAPALAMPLALPNAAENRDAKARAEATLYFRGLRPTGTVRIDINRRPELVVQDPLPTPEEAGTFFAIKAAPDLDLGEIVIVLDYSGSMTGTLAGKKLPGPDNAYVTGESRFNFALKALRDVLRSLPAKTKLKIRVFSDVGSAGAPGQTRLVRGESPDTAAVNWRPEDPTRLNQLMDALYDLKPDGTTPLIKTILRATKDFDSPPGIPKAMLVLTDGVDLDGGEKAGSLDHQRRLADLKRDMSAQFGENDIGLFVVQFFKVVDADSKIEADLSRDLFEQIGKVGIHRNPGRLWQTDNPDTLRDALRDALRPKLRLADEGGTPAHYPRIGWPARLADDRESFYWSPRVAVPASNKFDAKPYPTTGKTDQQVKACDGDRFILGFWKDGPATRIRRELYADNFADEVKRPRADGQYVLTVPGAGVDDSKETNAYRGLALLERVPDHHRYFKNGAAPDKLSLKHERPDLLWWDVSPTDADGTTPLKKEFGTTTIRKLYGRPAPAWEVRVDDWPRESGAKFAPARLTAWATDQAPTATMKDTLDATVPDAAVTLELPDGDAVGLRLAVEKHALGPRNGPAIDCLVVRATHTAGRPVVVQMLQPQGPHHAEHQYYRKADAVTALFGEAKLTPDSFRKVKLKVTAVAPAKTDANAIAFTPPAPKPGLGQEQDYRPQPADAFQDK